MSRIRPVVGVPRFIHRQANAMASSAAAKYAAGLVVLVLLAVIRLAISDGHRRGVPLAAITTALTPATNPIKKILIVSTWRSGSSFLGELVASSPGVFYSFEPMAKHVPSLFRCHFPDDYMQFINGTNHVKLNRRLWDECQHHRRPSLCHRPQLLAQICASFPVHLIKAVELSVRDLLSFATSSALVSHPVTDQWKIVYLVRDPRGTMSSRAQLDWCRANPNCREPARLCGGIAEDLDLLERHFGTAGRDYLLLKFEDLAVSVRSETEKLFRFLELPVTELTTAFLDSHTQSNDTGDGDPFSTVRQSDAVAFGWKTKLSPTQIDNITEICAPLLKKMGVII